MSELLPQQKPYFDMLLGIAGQGAYRAWVSLPAGWGKGHITVNAIRQLVQDNQVTNVLYVAPRCMQHQVGREFAQQDVQAEVVRNLYRQATPGVKVTICTERRWTQGHDTWIKYGGYDLVVLDLCRNPSLNRKTELAALQTTLDMGCRVWILGDAS